jgi:hypothetical protein
MIDSSCGEQQFSQRALESALNLSCKKSYFRQLVARAGIA